jgi:osmotically inducible protein OsmC
MLDVSLSQGGILQDFTNPLLTGSSPEQMHLFSVLKLIFGNKFYNALKKTSFMIRSGTAVWQGTGKEGKGHLTTQSTVLNQTQYSFGSRFADGIGTNPEELVAAAHAGCFAMKLTFVLGAAGFTPTSQITLDKGSITSAHIVLNAKVEGIDDARFAECVNETVRDCLISNLLNTTKTIEYKLNA